MTKDKLIKQLEEMGYEVTEGEWFIQVGGLFTIEPRKDDVYIHDEGTYSKQDLQALALISEYLNTPAAEREEKFTIQCELTGLYLHNFSGSFDWIYGVDEHGYFTKRQVERITNGRLYKVEPL